jgi:hypothetical protein
VTISRPETAFASKLLSVMILIVSSSLASAEPPFELGAICRTAIGSIVGHDPKSLQITRTANNVLFLTYVRPIDNFVWTYRCRIEGDRIVWASEPGRWREDPEDDKIFFEIIEAGAQLSIVENHADGSSTKVLFDRDMIQ